MRTAINVASVAELESLYGVGSVLAQRIVAYREQYGSFLGPEDLARVDGISLSFARHLSPSVDWSIPTSVEKLRVGDWLIYSAYIALTLLLLYSQSYISVVHITYTGLQFGEEEPTRALSITSKILATLIRYTPFVTLELWILSVGVNDLSFSDRRRYGRWLARTGACVGVVAGLTFISVSIWLALYLSLDGDMDWQRLISITALNCSGIAFTTWLIYALYPRVVVLEISAPRDRANKRILEASLWSVSLLNVVATLLWHMWPASMTHGVLAISSAGLALYTVVRARKGQPLLLDMFRWFGGNAGGATGAMRDWQRWLNRNVPDPQDQRMLKRTLDEMYGRSGLRTVLGVIVVSIGGWLALTSLGAVVEWIVQNWLDDAVR